MEIDINDLRRYKTTVTYDTGYRIVYYYEKYHEVEQGIYAKDLNDFITEIDKKDNINVEEILDIFLSKKPDALGVAIFDINQNCIGKKIKKDIININNTEVFREELIYDYNYKLADVGYRIVYFDSDKKYRIGLYCSTLEGFMMNFADTYPIIDSGDIPPFVSIDDLLNRFLSRDELANEIAIYDVSDGTCVGKKNRNKQM